MVSSTLCPAVHILGSQNVYSRAEGIADHYWPWAVFFFFLHFSFTFCSPLILRFPSVPPSSPDLSSTPVLIFFSLFLLFLHPSTFSRQFSTSSFPLPPLPPRFPIFHFLSSPFCPRLRRPPVQASSGNEAKRFSFCLCFPGCPFGVSPRKSEKIRI